ncbi:hypothetical protein FB45DRAFT_930191 [Roridomyces roridus]|uniref:Uncharacterized protein n=1 Tax=Roridomyces roridus TaxID=1738132 RepID=A0AAD7BHB7_9AGAR|nr:hypothetical protein FB45DRAFT_930191 [Roridomyces roridus]
MGNSLTTHYVPSWQDACAAKFNCSSSGLVDITGNLIAPTCPANGTLPTEVWGITAVACRDNCGSGMLRQSVDFTASAITITTWLLPWLALVAQLPFEARGWMNILSGLLALGSPALAAYSLALTAFNRWYTYRKFQAIKDKAMNDTHPEYHYMVERIEAAQFILMEVQQCPMRANQREGELASLIVIDEPHRKNFWKIAWKDLKNTRRGFTYSFLAQVVMAALAYLVSFIAAVHDSLGSPDVGLQFASSMVWSWMFPVVYGYVRVGSQYKAGCIKEAMTDNKIIPAHDISGRVNFEYQRGLCATADLHFPLSRRRPRPPQINVQGPTDGGLDIPLSTFINDGASTSQLSSADNQASTSQLSPTPSEQPLPSQQANDQDHSTAPLLPEAEPTIRRHTWMGIDVRGDERREGPIFNYARIFTWFSFTEHVRSGFATAVRKFRDDQPIPMTSEEAALICGFEPQQDLTAFAAWNDVPTTAIQHMIGAALFALFLQWGTTGAAIYVAYSTPFVGIGCRSGSYLIFGIAATLSWLLLVLAHLISHTLMQRLERNPQVRTGTGMLGALAVLTRLMGKGLAMCNALWIVASTVMEDIGTFQTCWCQTDAFQFGDRGWTAVFKASSDLRDAAGRVWIGGFVWSLLVCVLTMAFFAYGRTNR